MAAVNFPNPAATNPDTNAPYRDGWYNPDNGVTYIYVDAENAWKAATVNNANFDDIYVNEVGGDHMQGPLTIGPDDVASNATIELDVNGSADFANTISIGTNTTPTTGNAIIAYNQSGGTFYARNNGNDPVFQGAGNSGAVTSEIGADGSAEFAGDVQMASQNGGPLAGFRNQIINGDFRIWQRGTSRTFPDVYGQTNDFVADRFIIGTNATTTVSQTTDAPAGFDYAMDLTDTPGAINTSVELALDGSGDALPGPFYVGSVWTYSLWSNIDLRSLANNHIIAQWATNTGGSSGTTVGTVTDFILIPNSSSNGYNRYSSTITINSVPPSGTKCLALKLRLNTAAKATGIQLEPGPVATPFEHRPYGTELALCQRYFNVLGSGMVYGHFNSGVFRNVTLHNYPCVMRVPPAIGYNNGSFYLAAVINYATGSNVGTTDIANCTITNLTKNETDAKNLIRVEFRFTGDTSHSTNVCYVCLNDIFTADAEL